VIGVQLLVLAKAPVPGRVKTRLCPAYTPSQAAELAAAALADTLAAVAATPVAGRVLVVDDDYAAPGFARVRQRGDGLAERLAAAYDDAWAQRPLPMLLLGMDTPQVSPTLLAAAAGRLLHRRVDAVLGPAADGGFWALGLRRPLTAVTEGVPMSTSRTGAVQEARLRASGLRVARLPMLTDVDTPAAAASVAAAAPGTRFAVLHRAWTASGAA
jgi:rSAM/selenodomain-associated transferase 1